MFRTVPPVKPLLDGLPAAGPLESEGDDIPPHGTVQRYRSKAYGCNCVYCRIANAAYEQGRNARPGTPHGQGGARRTLSTTLPLPLASAIILEAQKYDLSIAETVRRLLTEAMARRQELE